MTFTVAAVSQTQSLAAIRNFVRASVSCITYARGLCNDTAYESKPFLGFELKHMVPKTLEAKTLSEWVEKGAFDALNRGFLKEMSLCVYNPDCSELLESYCFSFFYTVDKQRATFSINSEQYAQHLHLSNHKEQKCNAIDNPTLFDNSSTLPNHSRNPEKEQQASNMSSCNIFTNSSHSNLHQWMPQTLRHTCRKSKEEVQRMLAILLSRLVEVVESLPPLLTERVLTMRLTYYDKVVPATYEPPCFAPATDHMINMYKAEFIHNVELGVASTGHHVFTIAVRHPLLASIHNRLMDEHYSSSKSESSFNERYKGTRMKSEGTFSFNEKHVNNNTIVSSNYESEETNCFEHDNQTTYTKNYRDKNGCRTEEKEAAAAATAATTTLATTSRAIYVNNANDDNIVCNFKQNCALQRYVYRNECSDAKSKENAMRTNKKAHIERLSSAHLSSLSSEPVNTLELINFKSLKELMNEEESNTTSHTKKTETSLRRKRTAVCEECENHLRLVDVAYLLLVCFAFTKSLTATNGRGRFTSTELDEYLNHSCPLGLSLSQGIDVMNKLVAENYLTSTQRNLPSLDNKFNNDNGGKKQRSSDHKSKTKIHSANYAYTKPIMNNGSIFVEWVFVCDPPLCVVQWLLTQERVMELLSANHRHTLIELAAKLEKEKASARAKGKKEKPK